MTAGGDDMFSSNRASFAQRQATQEQLRATQEELATKIRELQIYESNFLQLKKELARWKKKFEFVFRENELLSVETAKLDASHKQIAFLQQELQFKAEESEALRGLVSALEAANKKARASRLDSAASRLASRRDLPETTAAGVALLDANDSSDVANGGGGDESAALETERRERAAERERLQREVAALQQENALLLKDLDRRAASLQLSEEQLAAHKQRIAALEDSLQVEQDKHMAQLREKQERIVALEEQILSLEQQRRRRSSAAVDHEDVGFGPTHRLQQHRRSQEKKTDEDAVDEDGDEDVDEPDTPPGTPPPISAGGLLPDVDPTVDQILRDWEDVKRVRAAPASVREAAAENWTRVQLSLLERLPFEAKEGATRVLQALLDPAQASTEFPESQVLVRAVPPECLHELQTFVVPLLKAHAHVRVTYATLQRRTLVTDVRLTLERRGDEYTGGLEKRLGRDHAFLGPSLDDPTRLVMHTPRVLTTEKKAVYVSKPQLHELQRALSASDGGATSMTSEHSTPPPAPPMTPGDDAAGASASQTSEPDGSTTTTTTTAHGGKKWRVPNALTLDKTKKLMGTMVAGAKQRVARRQQLKVVHEGTSCQFCKVSPIVGHRYSCATCVGFDLCENCYALGGHGLENSDELFYRAQELVLLRCPRLADELELLELLRFEICRSNLRKFSFCLNWLADIVNGKTSQQLQARALEIPGIRRDVRKQFVPLLLRVCSDREDLEVKTEWELESDNAAEVKSVATAGTRGASTLGGEGDNRFLETLRIWVADQYRTTSPFVERSLLKFREGMTVEGEDSEDDDGDDGGAHSDSEARDRFSGSGGDRGSANGNGTTRRRAATAAPRMSHANGSAFPRRNNVGKRPTAGDGGEREKATESEREKTEKEAEEEEEERMASSRRGFTERNRMMSQEF